MREFQFFESIIEKTLFLTVFFLSRSVLIIVRLLWASLIAMVAGSWTIVYGMSLFKIISTPSVCPSWARALMPCNPMSELGPATCNNPPPRRAAPS
jgi:hypothetical protein